MTKKIILSLLLLTFCLQAKESLWQAAPGHENKPVIFWAHYMPMVAHGFLHCSNHGGGNIDVLPFTTEDAGDDTLYREMKTALKSGINGFQFLTSVPKGAFEAAERIHKETGQIFYIAPEWCAMGNDTEKAAQKIADFAIKHKDSPHVQYIDGKMVMFLYGGGGWLGNLEQGAKIPEVRKIMKKRGVEVILIPTVGSYAKVLLDQDHLKYKNLKPFVKSGYGSGKNLQETNWDGYTSLNGGSNVRSDQVTEIKKLLKKSDKPFYLVPSIRTMYDSSNRFWQAIHSKGLGVRVLHRDLKLLTSEGFRLFTFSTWNDMMETMLMPSSRNPWGLNDIIKYYHNLASEGKSPFKEPHFVISYEPEVLLGDQGYFQFLVLPETECHSSDYTITVKMKNIHGKELMSFGNIAQIDRETEDDLTEVRYETESIIDNYMLMVPYVTIKQLDKGSGASRVLYDNVRLAPIRIRYNKLHYYTPYTISMNHVKNNAELDLEWENKTVSMTGTENSLEKIVLKTGSDTEFRKLNLNESCLSTGAFRKDDIKQEKTAYFIRLTAPRKVKGTLMVENGVVDSVYHAHWNFGKALKKYNKQSAPVDFSYEKKLPTVARILCSADSKIRIVIDKTKENVFEGTVEDLVKTPIIKKVKIGEEEITIDIRLTTDATDANIDYPLPSSGSYVRNIHIAKGHEALRIFHAWGLSKNDMISYSNPVALTIEGNSQLHPVKYLRTEGCFDDFVNDASSQARNPFTAGNIVSREVPQWLIPYFLLDFNEGCGDQVNHNGTSMQLARAWLGGDYKWIDKGWEGSSLQLNNGTLTFRSKTMPHGSMTVSMRLKLTENPAVERVIFEDADNWQMKLSGPLSLRIDADGRVVAHRVCSGVDAVVVSTKPLAKEWNHIVVTYDLNKLCLYINGELSKSMEKVSPTYQRTHSTPKLGVSKIAADKSGKKLTFSGEIDQLEIIGTALNSEEVMEIYKNGQWKKL